jgi:hypothetical protein
MALASSESAWTTLSKEAHMAVLGGFSPRASAMARPRSLPAFSSFPSVWSPVSGWSMSSWSALEAQFRREM